MHTHAYTHTLTFHGSISVSQRQQAVEQNNKYTNIYNFYSVKYY